jgi:hypothetical protein
VRGALLKQRLESSADAGLRTARACLFVWCTATAASRSAAGAPHLEARHHRQAAAHAERRRRRGGVGPWRGHHVDPAARERGPALVAHGYAVRACINHRVTSSLVYANEIGRGRRGQREAEDGEAIGEGGSEFERQRRDGAATHGPRTVDEVGQELVIGQIDAPARLLAGVVKGERPAPLAALNVQTGEKSCKLPYAVSPLGLVSYG